MEFKKTDVTAPATASVVPRRIMRLPEVEQRVGFKRAYIYRLMNEGKFPRCKRLGIRAVGWDSEKIDEWVNSHLQEETS